MSEPKPPYPLAASWTTCRDGRLNAEVAAVAVEAAEVGELLGVTAVVHLVVGLVEGAEW